MRNLKYKKTKNLASIPYNDVLKKSKQTTKTIESRAFKAISGYPTCNAYGIV